MIYKQIHIKSAHRRNSQIGVQYLMVSLTAAFLPVAEMVEKLLSKNSSERFLVRSESRKVTLDIQKLIEYLQIILIAYCRIW